ncbi:MAG: DNA polymerase domain-containing protein [Gemmatimonadota bacterium]
MQDEWLWGWDPTPGIVSVWAEGDGTATVWRRVDDGRTLLRERSRFRPWLLLDSLEDIEHLGRRLQPADGDVPTGASFASDPHAVHYQERSGTGALRYLVSASTFNTLTTAVLDGAARRTGTRTSNVRDLGETHVFVLPPDEQYLVATGRTYFRELTFDKLHRLQFDLETTGLDPEHARMFMVAVRLPSGETRTLEAENESRAAEGALIRQLMDTIRQADPDVIENHNLHGFDLPFLVTRARKTGVPLVMGRTGRAGLLTRGAQRGTPSEYDSGRRVRYVAPGREMIDTLDAVRRYDFSTRDLPSHGLKAVARHLGIAGPEREYIRGDQIYATYTTDPERVRRYATDDVQEVSKLAEMLGGAAFALARMAPRRYERLADAGAATGVIDPLLVRAYLRAGAALPAHANGDGTTHTGAALHLFATGVAHRVVKADVASLYPSLMRQYRIGPARDELGAMLALVDRLVEQRLAAKSSARSAPAGSAERHSYEAMSAAMKIVINSAYGYLGAGGGLTRFADVHAANEVTRRGRETLGVMCRELAARGVTLLEADTDGVYFAVPASWTETDERAVVADVAALLPPLVQLEFEGRYAAMLSHEPKNYALLGYDGRLTLRGVAFRSSRAEPFGESFLRTAIERLLRDDVPGVHAAYIDCVSKLRRGEVPVHAVSSLVRLTKSPEEYGETRERRRELAYEAMLASGRSSWRVGERARVYRTTGGGGAVVEEREDGDATVPSAASPEYDAAYYVRLLRDSFAARLARAFEPDDFDVLFADPMQHTLFDGRTAEIRPVLRTVDGAPG